MLDWLRRLLIKESRTTSSFTELAAGAPILTARDFEALATAGYKTNPYVFAGIQDVARGVGGLPFVAQKVERDGTLTPVDKPGDDLVRLLRWPNPRQSWASFIETGISYYYLAGEMFIERTAPVLELYQLRPDRVAVIPGARQHMIAGWVHTIGGIKTPYRPEEVLQIKTFNPLNDWRGLSILEAAAVSIDQNNAARKWNTSLVQNQGKMGLALVTDGELSDRAWARQNKLEEDKYSGPMNAGKARIFEGGLKPMPMSHSPKEADWLKGLQHSGLEIAIVLNVPPEILGDSTNKTYSNYQEARKALMMETVLPLGELVAKYLTFWLAPVLGDDMVIGIDRDQIDILQEDRNSVWTRAVTAKDSGVITPDEAREEIGHEPSNEDGADKLQARIGTGFLEDLTLEADPDPPPGDGNAADPPDPDNPDPEGDTNTGKSGNAPGRSKAFGLTTEAQRLAHWKLIDRKRNATIKAVERLVRARFRAEKTMLIGKMRNALTPEQAASRAAGSLEREGEKWKTLLDAIYLEIGRPFAEDVISRIKANALEFEYKGPDDTVMDVWMSRVLDWLANNSGLKITQINQTTLIAIQEMLAEGVAAGESIDQLAKRLDTLYLEKIIPHRSKTIARTEVISASNLGSQEAAKATGLPLRKVWLATGDAKTRDAHADEDGNAEAVDTPYNLNGELLMFPGDSSLGASAGQTINCRCSETYEVVKQGERVDL